MWTRDSNILYIFILRFNFCPKKKICLLVFPVNEFDCGFAISVRLVGRCELPDSRRELFDGMIAQKC